MRQRIVEITGKLYSVVLLFMLSGLTETFAATRWVGGCGPGASYATIQAAVDASAAGDEVAICRGTHSENVSINNKNHLTIRSSTNDRSDVTVTSNGTTFNITGGSNIRLAHLTIRGQRAVVVSNSTNGLTLEGLNAASAGASPHEAIQLTALNVVIRNSTISAAPNASGEGVVRVEAAGGLTIEGVTLQSTANLPGLRVKKVYDRFSLRKTRINAKYHGVIVDNGSDLTAELRDVEITGGWSSLNVNDIVLDIGVATWSRNRFIGQGDHGIFCGRRCGSFRIVDSDVISNNTSNWDKRGIKMDHAWGAWRIERVSVRGKGGIEILGGFKATIDTADVTATDNSRDGILVKDNHQLAILRSKITAPRHGINLGEGPSNNTSFRIEHNEITTTGNGDGVRGPGNTSEFVINDNVIKIHGQNGTGVYLPARSSNGEMLRNRIEVASNGRTFQLGAFSMNGTATVLDNCFYCPKGTTGCEQNNYFLATFSRSSDKKGNYWGNGFGNGYSDTCAPHPAFPAYCHAAYPVAGDVSKTDQWPYRRCRLLTPPPPPTPPAGFNCVEVGAPAATGRLYTKLAGVAFAFDVVALKADGSQDTSYASGGARGVTVELVNASGGGACAALPALTPPVSTSLTFTASDQGRKTTTPMTVNRAWPHVKCRITDANQQPSVVACSSDAYAIRPQAFTAISSNANADASGASPSAAPVIKAGDAFTLSATALPGYDGTPTIDASKTQAHPGAARTGTPSGAFAAADPASGTASGTSFRYDEAGYFRLLPYGVVDTGFTAVDAASGDCTADFSNTPVGGKYGCWFGNGTASAYFGRFIPHHFDTEVTPGCGGFTYSGQPFGLKVTAKNAGGGITQNYRGTFAKNVTLADANGNAGSFSPASVASTSFSNGIADLTTPASVAFTFSNKRTAPATIQVRATDGEASSANGTEGSTAIRSGRLVLSNAHGSEKLPLAMPLETQYWNGGVWLTNSDDSCTDITSSLVFVKNPAALPTPSGGGISQGKGTLTFTAPNQKGSVEVCANIGSDGNHPVSTCRNGSSHPWLQGSWDGDGQFNDNPAARATFGIYEQRRPVIYRRERY